MTLRTNCWHEIASLTMSARVKHFSSTLQHALKEERHFALLDGVAFSNRRLARNRFQARTQSDPCISSVATAIMTNNSNRETVPDCPELLTLFPIDKPAGGAED